MIKKTGFLKKLLWVIIGILALFGVLFIIVMLWPEGEDEISPDTEGQGISASAVSAENSDTETGVHTAANTGNPQGFNPSLTGLGNVTSTAAGDITEGREPESPVSSAGSARSGTATVMVYMNGSDLESQAGAASSDIYEMLDSGIGQNVNVIIQTMGTREWQAHGISSRTAQTWKISDGELVLIRDDLGQLDCTSSDTLSEFVDYCKKEYPADRYMFIFWDHGGGPVYGFGYDEWQSEDSALTIAEMAKAFSQNSDVNFDIIGMDCCIMANLETCYALSPYCKYTLLSEDFESEIGWSYSDWMKQFEETPTMSTPLLGKYIVDSIIESNETSFYGDSSCVSLFNESRISNLFDAWKIYAYQNEKVLMSKDYSTEHHSKGRGGAKLFDMWESDSSNVTLSDYYISDMLALVESVDSTSDAAKNLISALKASVAYYGHTSDKNELTGLAVSLPYGDPYFYKELKGVYSELGFDKEYIDWLGGFASSSVQGDHYDYAGFENSWGGWGTYEEDYGCTISGGQNSDSCYGDYSDSSLGEDWTYDYEDDLWYTCIDNIIYIYDEVSDEMYCYDESDGSFYYYDENDDEWYLIED